jgi:uncharacterized RDD family membrane protein YckC
MAKLIVNPTSSSRREIALARQLVSIGRDPSNDVVLPDAMVSRRHAVIEYRGSQYYLRDCNSSNGSLVNGDRVSERSLRDGDLVAIGTARMLFKEELEAEDAAGKVVQHPSAPRLHCPNCQADYRKGDLFCRQCGTSVAPAQPAKAVCASCGTVVPLPAKFCNACGKSLPEGSAGPAADPPPAPPSAPAPEDGPPSRAEAPANGAPDATPAAAPPEAAPPLPSSHAAPRVADPPAAPIAAAVATPAVAARAAAVAIAPPAAPPRREPPPMPRPAARPHGAAGRPGPKSVPPRQMTAPVTGTESLPGRPRADAGPMARFAAGVVDFAIVGTLQAALLWPVLSHWWSRDLSGDVPFTVILVSLLSVPLILAAGGAYFALFWGLKGATPGKRLLGIAVAGEDGAIPIGLSRATLRVLGYAVSTLLLGIGFLMIAFGGTALHDKMAGTRVVQRGRG